jgi:hypothetical protein
MHSSANVVTSKLLRATAADLPPLTTEVSATLPVGAGTAYAVLTDAVAIPRWLPVVRVARVLETDGRGRATRVAFVARLVRGSISYTLDYRFADELAVEWSTGPESSVRIVGSASVVPLAARSCLLRYQLAVELPVDGDFDPPWFGEHHASSVVAALREHLRELV